MQNRGVTETGPLHPILADALTLWKQTCSHGKPADLGFSPPADRLHTFRHTYSTLLRSVGAEFKVMQELMRHSSLRTTLNVYMQAVTPAKHEAQAAVLSLVFPLQVVRADVESPPHSS